MQVCTVTQSCLTLCDPMDFNRPGSSVHGIFQGKNTGVSCHFLLQTQGWNLCLLHPLHWQVNSLLLSLPESQEWDRRVFGKVVGRVACGCVSRHMTTEPGSYEPWSLLPRSLVGAGGEWRFPEAGVPTPNPQGENAPVAVPSCRWPLRLLRQHFQASLRHSAGSHTADVQHSAPEGERQ